MDPYTDIIVEREKKKFETDRAFIEVLSRGTVNAQRWGSLGKK